MCHIVCIKMYLLFVSTKITVASMFCGKTLSNKKIQSHYPCTKKLDLMQKQTRYAKKKLDSTHTPLGKQFDKQTLCIEQQRKKMNNIPPIDGPNMYATLNN